MKFTGFLVTGFLLLSSARAEEEVFTSQQKQAFGKVINDHLMKNPEVLGSALEQLQQKQMKEQMEKNKALIQENSTQLFDNPDDYFAGSVDASVTIAVFMDPYCGHCRKFHDILAQALDTSKNSGIKNLKIIFKDLPIFGEASEKAVKAMLAAKLQGKYLEFQKEMFREEQPVKQEEIMKVASRLGLDQTRLSADMNSEKVQSIIAKNRKLAETLGITGTPTIIVGELLIPGAMNLANLKELVSQELKKASGIGISQKEG